MSGALSPVLDASGFDAPDGEARNRGGLAERMGSMLLNVSALSRAANARPATAAASTVNHTRTSSVTQNVSIDNTYNGTSTEGAKNVTKAMKKSASDATDYMARALRGKTPEEIRA